jgi:haloacetate dehalogenase
MVDYAIDTLSLFPDFREEMINVSGGDIRALIGGEGPPLLLLHGHPQTLAMWHKIADGLARHFTLVLTDLRGYGRSWKPESTADHGPYTKRESAKEQVAVMERLGFKKFGVVSHDRGARVAHRMALDWPDRLTRLTLIDIVPTATMYANVSREFATTLYHWFLTIQPFPFPERMISGCRDLYLDAILFGLSNRPHPFVDQALAEYRACYTDASIHAMCEDYRAGATTDLMLDASDNEARISCPTQVIWGKHSPAGRFFEPLTVWRGKALNVTGCELNCGHFIPEEMPEEVLAELLQFHR